MNKAGVASDAWGRYDPRPVATWCWKPRTSIRLVPSETSLEPNYLADFIEGAEWWLARSRSSVRYLKKLFDQQEVACVLYERVGAMVPVEKLNEYYLIGIQLVRGKDDWMLDISLSDAGIYLEELWKPESENNNAY